MKGDTNMEKLHELKEKLWAELEELAEKREMGAGDLEVVHKITDTIKRFMRQLENA